jgi:hypothetical protein
LLDNAHIGTICTRVQYAADTCPAGSQIGNAVATTPILAQPLRGPVYLRSSNHQLPDLVVSLRGQVDLELVGVIDTTRQGGLRTTFQTAPDAPVTEFVLNLSGGKKGLLINSEDLCKSPQKATVNLLGHNGKRLRQRTGLQTHCGKRAKKRKRLGAQDRARRGRANVSLSRKAG